MEQKIPKIRATAWASRQNTSSQTHIGPEKLAWFYSSWLHHLQVVSMGSSAKATHNSYTAHALKLQDKHNYIHLTHLCLELFKLTKRGWKAACSSHCHSSCYSNYWQTYLAKEANAPAKNSEAHGVAARQRQQWWQCTYTMLKHTSANSQLDIFLLCERLKLR